jgi:eukaryotic-like serine/threonine-protein kinase
MPSSGDKIAHYKIIALIGKGGMGEVYLAEDTRLERQVALKILLDDVAGDEDRVRRFIREAKAVSALNHPNILTVYEIGEHGNSRYIATELIKGKTLREQMRHESIGLNEGIGIALQAAASLSAAHEAGILHRDIKPENIMVRGDGLVKVLDFGLAKLAETPPGLAASEDPTLHQKFDTQPGMIVGTVAYMSPEQVRGKKLDARSDIFSLGIVMYELFTGKFPFAGEGHLELASAILKDEPQPISQIVPGLPRQLERIVDKALRKNRDNRYQHVKDLQIDLEDLRDELRFESKQTRTADQILPASTTQTFSLSESISTTRRFTLLHALIFVAAAAVLVGAAWYLRPGFLTPARAPGSYKTNEIASWSSAAGELYSSAAFSPDGTMIAFASTKSGSKNIWVTQTVSNAVRQLTNDPFANIDPIWSPKGNEIAYFVAGRRTGGVDNASSGIWRVPALGGAPPILIASLPNSQSRIRRWTPSGKIYYQVNNDLYAVTIDSGISQKITSIGEGQVRWMDVSADERSMAYGTQNNDNWRIVVQDLSGSGPAEVAAGAGKFEGAAWLPQSKRLFYSATVDGVLQTFVTDIGSGRSRQITASETDASVVDASPDGKSIIITSSKEESNLWRVAVQDAQETPVIRDINSKIFPAVSPANDKVAFQSYKNLNQGNKILETAVVVKGLKTRDDERPAQLAEHGFMPAWSPDGSSVAFLSENNSLHDLSLVNANGGAARKLATDVKADSFSVSPYNYTQTQPFAWSPDGAQIAYVSKKSGASNVWTVRPGDGVDAMWTDNAEPGVTFSCPIWSPDGKRLAYALQQGNYSGFRYVDIGAAQGNDAYQAESFIRLIGWSPDGTGLIFADRAGSSGLPPETVIKRVNLAGGAETAIATLKNTYFYNIFLSDDRKLIAFAARNDDRDDIWTVSTSGGPARKLTANNDNGLYYSRLAWLHDGSAIVFGKQTRFSLLSMITDID